MSRIGGHQAKAVHLGRPHFGLHIVGLIGAFHRHVEAPLGQLAPEGVGDLAHGKGGVGAVARHADERIPFVLAGQGAHPRGEVGIQCRQQALHVIQSRTLRRNAESVGRLLGNEEHRVVRRVHHGHAVRGAHAIGVAEVAPIDGSGRSGAGALEGLGGEIAALDAGGVTFGRHLHFGCDPRGLRTAFGPSCLGRENSQAQCQAKPHQPSQHSLPSHSVIPKMAGRGASAPLPLAYLIVSHIVRYAARSKPHRSQI